MRISIAIFLFFITGHSFSQGVLSTSQNILFRGYENIVEIAGNYKKPFIVTSSDGVSLVLKGSAPLTYSAYISGGKKTANIYVVSENLRDTLANYTFRIKNLPPPDLYWGTHFDSLRLLSAPAAQFKSFNAEIDSVLWCGYGNESIGPNTIDFAIQAYEIKFDGLETRMLGKGNIISKEHLERLKTELEKPRETEYLEVTVDATVKGPDGVTRKKSVIFQLK